MRVRQPTSPLFGRGRPIRPIMKRKVERGLAVLQGDIDFLCEVWRARRNQGAEAEERTLSTVARHKQKFAINRSMLWSKAGIWNRCGMVLANAPDRFLYESNCDILGRW